MFEDWLFAATFILCFTWAVLSVAKRLATSSERRDAARRNQAHVRKWYERG